MTDKPKIKVLIVEDEDSIRKIYAEYLRNEGFEVQEAQDGEEAVKMVDEFDYDIMLLDIMLPKVDGLEVLKKVKGDPKLKSKKVYMLTVLGRDSFIKEGFESGADGYLIKDQETPETIKQNILKALGK